VGRYAGHSFDRDKLMRDVERVIKEEEVFCRCISRDRRVSCKVCKKIMSVFKTNIKK
jgi:hypothetical protein